MEFPSDGLFFASGSYFISLETSREIDFLLVVNSGLLVVNHGTCHEDGNVVRQFMNRV